MIPRRVPALALRPAVTPHRRDGAGLIRIPTTDIDDTLIGVEALIIGALPATTHTHPSGALIARPTSRTPGPPVHGGISDLVTDEDGLAAAIWIGGTCVICTPTAHLICQAPPHQEGTTP